MHRLCRKKGLNKSFRVPLWTVSYPKTCYNEPCYKEVQVYKNCKHYFCFDFFHGILNYFIGLVQCNQEQIMWVTIIKRIFVQFSIKTCCGYSDTRIASPRHFLWVPTIYQPRHEKICFGHMWTTKAQISLHIRAVWSAPLLNNLLLR